ncbi:hypothetical protein SCEN_D05080 [Saccharomyces cerevisiae]|nr:hypothetical protein SCEN_D05080 [Saccharomyces cerevisiae]
MRSLEPPRSKKRIHLIAAVKAVKSIKPIRTTLRYDEAITYNKDIKEKEKIYRGIPQRSQSTVEDENLGH